MLSNVIGPYWISRDLSWGVHVEYIIKKAQKKLFFLRTLKRSKMSNSDIMGMFCSQIRPILEYAAPLWHSGITKEHTADIEQIQIRACKITAPHLDYPSDLSELVLPTLEERRVGLCRSFFMKIQDPKDKLFKILPKKKRKTVREPQGIVLNIPSIKSIQVVIKSRFYRTPYLTSNRTLSFILYIILCYSSYMCVPLLYIHIYTSSVIS